MLYDLLVLRLMLTLLMKTYPLAMKKTTLMQRVAVTNWKVEIGGYCCSLPADHPVRVRQPIQN
jgi:hypothetical protein